MICVGEPKVYDVGNSSRLSANISYNGENKEFYFEIPSEYKKYLCTEVSDAFLVGIFNYAVSLNEDIKFEGKISERLLYQFRTYFIPTLANNRKGYSNIKIIAEPFEKTIQSEGVAATSASGGVDSFYSIVRHLEDVPERYKVSHLLIVNQFNRYVDEKITRKRFDTVAGKAEKIAVDFGLKIIPMYTNHHEFHYTGFVTEYSLRICSYALALQKLIAVYYVSSGVPFHEFTFESHDTDGMDIFNLSMMTNDNISFYSSGGEVVRTEKLKYICKHPGVQKNMHVCNYNDEENCSECEKCMRTMVTLDVLGDLEFYKDVFNLEKYRKNRNKYLCTVESYEFESSHEILDAIREYNYHVPIGIIIYGRTIRRFGLFIKHIIGKSQWIRNMYYKLKIDFIVKGKKHAIIDRYGTKYQID